MLSSFSKVYNKVFVTNVLVVTLLLSCSLNTPNSTTPKKVDLKSNSLTSKPFKINGLSTLKVPFIPKEFGFNNYYGNYIYLKADPTYIRQYGSDCWNGDCTNTWFENYISLDGYYHDRGLISFSSNGFHTWSYYTHVLPKNLNTEYIEINKKYDLLSEFQFASFPYYGSPVFSQRKPETECYLQATKVDDTQIKLSIIAKNLDSGVIQGYYNQILDHFIQYRLDNFEQYVVMAVTSDELTLNVTNNELNDSINTTDIIATSSSSTRNWILRVFKNSGEYFKEYTGTGNLNTKFPDGVNLSSLPEGLYKVFFYYVDQPNESIIQEIVVKQDSDAPVITNDTYAPFGEKGLYSVKANLISNPSNCTTDNTGV